MIGGLSISRRGSLVRVQAASARWIAGALALTSVVWLVALAGFLGPAHPAPHYLAPPLAGQLPLFRDPPHVHFPRQNRPPFYVDGQFGPPPLPQPPPAA